MTAFHTPHCNPDTKTRTKGPRPLPTHNNHQVPFKVLFQSGKQGCQSHPLATLFSFSYDKYNNLKNISSALHEEEVELCIRLWQTKAVPGAPAWERLFPKPVPADAAHTFDRLIALPAYEFVRTWITNKDFVLSYWGTLVVAAERWEQHEQPPHSSRLLLLLLLLLRLFYLPTSCAFLSLVFPS